MNLNIKNNESNNASNTNPLSLSYYPKIEMIGKKEIDNNYNVENRKIETLMSKFIPKSLSGIFKQMSNLEKKKVYNTLADVFQKINREEIYPLEAQGLAMNYYNRALLSDTTDIKNAYKQFDLFRISGPSDKGAEKAELCLKLSNYKDTENKFAEIYYYLGKYYYLNKNDYKKALEQYEKVLDYSDSKSFEYQSSKLYIARLYDHLGNLKKAIETVNELRDYEPNFPSSLNQERAERFKTMMMDNWHEEVDLFKSQLQEKLIEQQAKGFDKCANTEEKINKNEMYNQFKDCKDKYPEEILIEAYKHYQKAESLCRENRHLQAVEEFKKVKEILPEQTNDINNRIRMLINCYTVSDDNKEYYYNYKIQILNEDLEIAIKTNNKDDLCNVYNEMAITYEELNDTNKTIKYMKKAVDIAGLASIYGTNLANCYESLGLYDEALNIYKFISENNPSFAEQYDINLDPQISRLNDLKQGKRWGENPNIHSEHSQKGDEYFNKQDYVSAFSEYNASYELDKKEISYLIKMLMVKEMYETEYLYEMQIVSNTLMTCEQNDKIEYLPFLLTLCGDYIMYEFSTLAKEQAENCYEIAIDLLNKVSTNEKFAAPYYKLARIKEQQKKYQEAMTLYQFTNIIDKYYDTEKDIERIRLMYADDGISNKKSAERLVLEMEFCLNSKSFSEVIIKGKKALEYDPNNVKAYYLICKAFEALKDNLSKNQRYEFKWFAMEGLKATNINYCKVSNEGSTDDIFYWFLGICCKLENKKEQANYYFDRIIDLECLKNTVIETKAREERMGL